MAKVKSHIDDAVEKGAKLVCSGRIRDDLGGYFIEPALLTGVTPAMAVAREETFGPLAPVFTFDTIEECINDIVTQVANLRRSKSTLRTLRPLKPMCLKCSGVVSGAYSQGMLFQDMPKDI